MTSEIKTTCRVCGGEKFKSWGQRDGLKLYECENCELVFFYPYPTAEELDKFYNDTYHADRDYSGESKAGTLRKQMYELDIKDLEETISGRGRFLDVGCAEGAFLSMLSPSWDRFGVDLSRTAVEKGKQRKEKMSLEAKDIADCETGFYDVVHLRGVFEHLLEPGAFVKTANEKLKKGGYLVLSNTPNSGGPIPRLFRGRYKLVLPNEHLHYFSKKTMAELMERNGFRVKKITYPYFNTPYSSFFKNLLEVPFNYLTGKQSPAFWGNIFTVYAEKVKED